MTDDPMVTSFDALDEWADWDAQQDTMRAADAGDTGPLRFGFYGRVSTEDQQDPEASKNWQKTQAVNLLAVNAPGAVIVEDYFDVGHSRSLPWSRRPEARRLLTDLTDPNRGWDGIVVGEGKRCWYGSQFTDVAPILQHHDVALFVPELSGRYDPDNSSHYTLMTVTGGMSLGERKTVQVRVRAGMGSQVELQGRYQGGRAPYGYRAVGFQPHPNPRKAAEGYQQKRLEVDPLTGPVVSRIFAEAKDRKTLREIATDLNREGILCPSAADPARNSHRTQDGWQVSTVKYILENVRYTGYENWGKTTKKEELLVPTDQAQGYTTKQVKNPDGPTRSARPAHPPLVSVHDFVAVQNEFKRRTSGDTKGGNRASVRVSAPYPLRGLVYCAACGRKMSPDWYRKKNDAPDKPIHVRYRCRRKDLVEGSEKWQDHPNDVTVQQSVVLENVHQWLAWIFGPENRDTLVDTLVGSRADAPTSLTSLRREQDAHRLKEAEGRLENQMRALDKGVDPELLAPRIKSAQDEIATLQAVLATYPTESAPQRDDVAGLVERWADRLDEVFGEEADFADLHVVLTGLGLRIDYDSQSGAAVATLNVAQEADNPHGGGAVGVRDGVRGGT